MIRLVVATIVSVSVGASFQPAGSLASIQGQVTDSSGRPLRKAGVTIRASGGGPQALSPYAASFSPTHNIVEIFEMPLLKTKTFCI